MNSSPTKIISLDPRDRIIDLKTINPYYNLVQTDQKLFEVRNNDRKFQSGNILHLREYDIEKGYSGRSVYVRVFGYILEGPLYGLEAGYVIMNISKLPADELISRELVIN